MVVGDPVLPCQSKSHLNIIVNAENQALVRWKGVDCQSQVFAIEHSMKLSYSKDLKTKEQP
jgi:hypothetical protein